MLKNITMSIYQGVRKLALIYFLILCQKEYYSNAAMCIDEPEVHMGLRAQGKLLEILYELIPEKSQNSEHTPLGFCIKKDLGSKSRRSRLLGFYPTQF